jgi:hypothetical protein
VRSQHADNVLRTRAVALANTATLIHRGIERYRDRSAGSGRGIALVATERPVDVIDAVSQATGQIVITPRVGRHRNPSRSVTAEIIFGLLHDSLH